MSIHDPSRGERLHGQNQQIYWHRLLAAKPLPISPLDRFASSYNTQLSRLNSRFWTPGLEAVDAFTLEWSRENNWSCPPVNQIIKVVTHLRQCQAVGTLIVPLWPSAPFWQFLVPKIGYYMSGVVDSLILQSLADMFIPGTGQMLVYKREPSIFSGKLTFTVLACHSIRLCRAGYQSL